MGRQTAAVVLWAVVYAAAMAANLGSFWMGDGASLPQLGLTALYGVVCLLFLTLAHGDRKRMKCLCVLGAVSVAAGVLCLLARAGVAWAAIPALILSGILFTPFYGWSHLEILGDWDVFYGVMLAAGAVWTVLCAGALLKKRNEKQN